MTSRPEDADSGPINGKSRAGRPQTQTAIGFGDAPAHHGTRVRCTRRRAASPQAVREPLQRSQSDDPPATGSKVFNRRRETALSVLARCATSPPSPIWPEDRSWFVGTPIYSNEIAVAGSRELIDTVLHDNRLSTRRATPDDDLDIDD
jgi:hypothetical protein